MKIEFPELSLVVLVGPSGAGKSTFARKHFRTTEVLSSDYCRALIADDENDQTITTEAFDLLHVIAGKRLAAGKLTVVDATSVKTEDRKPLVALARAHHCLPVAIVFDLGARLCTERNEARADRTFGSHVIRNQQGAMRRSMRFLRKEGFRHTHVFKRPADVEAAVIERTPLWNNKRHEHGPFDIIGDVHGCYDELAALLRELGYAIAGEPGDASFDVAPPAGRRSVFLGDLVDRGPKIPQVLRLVMHMVRTGTALCVPGNHDIKLMRKLRGKNVQITHGLADSLEQLDREPESFHAEVAEFLDALVSHYVLDEGKLVVAHAGMKENMQGRGSGAVREFALYGETTGETDEFGLPIRYNWAAEYRGRAAVVYGHTPVPEPEWLNHTINIDTGCVFGGRLTALRYPENQLVSVPAERTYAESRRPFLNVAPSEGGMSAQHVYDDVLDLADLTGKRIISTRLYRSVTVGEQQNAAALEVMSRFAVNPKWLIYLPPTMAPCATSQEPGLLEHPHEAFSEFRNEGRPHAICEEKHMGSRAIVVVCRDAETAARRFGVEGEQTGVVYTRTGRAFFDDAAREAELLEIVRAALTRADLWGALSTDWVCLDCELMPWSAKAQTLLREQYAAVGAAARAGLADATATLETAKHAGRDVNALIERYRTREQQAEHFVQAYRRYCWPVDSVNDLKLAPFHVLASEGKVHVDRDHVWHMSTLADVCAAADGGVLLATPFKIVDLTDPASEADATAWWSSLTERGGEGMVVKPLDFFAKGGRGLVQPAIKCRGVEYLRIIYGSEYTSPEHLNRLRNRHLGRKRMLALREFALGVEALERFVRREPLRRVHECVFGVLAMESEPVDPRL